MHLVPVGEKKKHRTLPLYNICTAKVSLLFLFKVCWEVLYAAWKEEAGIKDKMKGQKAQRSEYRKRVYKGEKIKTNLKSVKTTITPIRNLRQMEQIEVEAKKIKKCKCEHICV